jgi:hypothetical protein
MYGITDETRLKEPTGVNFINVLLGPFGGKAHFWCQNFVQKLYFGSEIFGAKVLH